MKHIGLFLLVFIFVTSACAGPAPTLVVPVPSPTTGSPATPLPTKNPLPSITSTTAPTSVPTSSPTNPPVPTGTTIPSGIEPDNLGSLAQLHTFRPFDINSLMGLLAKGGAGGANLSNLQSSLFPPSYLAMAYSPDGQTLALGGCSNTLDNLFECPSPGKPVLRLMNAQTG